MNAGADEQPPGTAPTRGCALIVYGSLKRGEENHRFLADQRYLAEVRTAPGYRLYALDGYPGMVCSEARDEFVTGELWEIAPDRLQELDAFEGVDVGLYRREPVPLAPPHATIAAEAYVYAQSVSGRKLLGHTWKGAR